MATKKITLNELRSIIKKVIKEEMVLNEALNKDMLEFRDDLIKYCKNAGLEVKYVEGYYNSKHKEYIDNHDAVAFELHKNEEYIELIMHFSAERIKPQVDKIVNKFQLAHLNGKERKVGWDTKQVTGALNPGDIYLGWSSVNDYTFYRQRAVQTSVKTTDYKGKSTYKGGEKRSL